MGKLKKRYSISVMENFTEKKLEICVTDHKVGMTASIPAKHAKEALKEFRKAVKKLK